MRARASRRRPAPAHVARPPVPPCHPSRAGLFRLRRPLGPRREVCRRPKGLPAPLASLAAHTVSPRRRWAWARGGRGGSLPDLNSTRLRVAPAAAILGLTVSRQSPTRTCLRSHGAARGAGYRRQHSQEGDASVPLGRHECPSTSGDSRCDVGRCRSGKLMLIRSREPERCEFRRSGQRYLTLMPCQHC
jgi:hypothetical protein